MYSQNHEEEIILDYFKDLATGSLLDIGCNDGITLSNSRALIEKGWFADMCDPSPAAFSKLTNLYKDNNSVALHSVAIGRDEETVLYESGPHLNKGDVGLLSSTVRSELDRWDKETFTPVKVQSLSIKTFLKVAVFDPWDFISIDAEACDLMILRQMDLTELGCRCLCIEWNNKQNIRREIIDYCSPHSLRVVHQNAENLILCRPK